MLSQPRRFVRVLGLEKESKYHSTHGPQHSLLWKRLVLELSHDECVILIIKLH